VVLTARRVPVAAVIRRAEDIRAVVTTKFADVGDVTK
jgi:hypothetical protein